LVESKWRICAAVVEDAPEALQRVAPLVDLFELRIDLIGSGWRDLAAGLEKPWIACNRRVEEDGRWQGSESGRISELISAVELGADIVDIELATPDLASVVREVKGRTDCLLSHHDLKGTPSLDEMKSIVERQLDAGADICKVVTTARNITDNISVIRLVSCFPGKNIIAFAMGAVGYLSRVLSPLAGGYLTYASIAEGLESAPGQITVDVLYELYGLLDK